jgi:predicted transcriptional regulator
LQPAESLAKLLEIRVGPPADALDRFEAAWNRLAEGSAVRTLRILTVASLPLALKVLTAARWALLEKLKDAGPSSVYRLAKLLERDYKNVHQDVSELLAVGLIARDAKNQVVVPWDAVRMELRL